MEPLLNIRRLSIAFAGHQAVNELDLTLARGETLALVGESGCGKSATALSILRQLPPGARCSGSIEFEGDNLLTLPEKQLRRLRGNRISMIFQEPMTSLNPVYTVGKQIGEVLRLHLNLSARAARERAIELLDLVNIPQPARRVDSFVHHLSGGQRQRVMIAMAVACEPTLLIADEPTTALDVTTQAQILALLDSLRHKLSMSLLLITHDLGLVSHRADRVAVMYAGRKVEEGETAPLFSQPRHDYTRGLLATSLHGKNQPSTRTADPPQPPHYRAGRLPEIRHAPDAMGNPAFQLVLPGGAPAFSAGPDADAPVLLALRDVHTHYHQGGSRIEAVSAVSFSLRRGETLGLVGESGCGKSTLSRTIIRLLKPSSGSIIFDGQEIARSTERQLRPLRRHIQMIFQDPFASLNPRHSVETILNTVLKVNGLADRRARRQKILRMIDNVGLARNSLYRFPHEFSGGQRQRIGIARALITGPALVICDEAVSALDVSVQAQILNLLVNLKQELGLSYLFISHDLAVVRYISDRVMVMHEGRIVETGGHQSLWNQPQHPYTRRLLSAVPG